MRFTQNHLEHLQDLLERGKISADQANVEKVKMARVHLVESTMPRTVRNALNQAVKNGELARMKRDGNKPEAFYHPDFKHLAKEARNRREREKLNAIKKIIS